MKLIEDNIVFVSACLAAIGGALFGYDIGVISGAMLQLKKDFLLTEWQETWVVSIMLVGACLGSLMGGYCVDVLGRKGTIIATSFNFVAGSVMLGCANNLTVILVGRFVVGLSVSLSALSDCMYIAEISPSEKRGFLVSLNELAITVGFLLAYMANYVFSFREEGWRIMFLLPAVPAFLQGIAMFVLPASPRWLVLKGRLEEALTVLKRLRKDREVAASELKSIQGMDLEKEIFLVDSELGEGVPLRKNSTTSNTSLYERMCCLLVKAERRSLLIGCGVVFFQQFTGQPTLLYFAPTIFERAGFEETAALICTVIMGLIKFLTTALALVLVDYKGRRFLLLMGILMMTVALFILAYSMNGSVDDYFLQLCSVGSVMVYVMGYAISFGPNGWLLLSEIFPPRIRGQGMGYTSLLNWGSNLVVSLTFLKVIALLTPSGAFVLYAIVCIWAFQFVYSNVPETKGCTLEEITTVLMNMSEQKSSSFK
eukprot:Nk52_evm17s1524 gene=Nk52_evmTU17s1524